MKKSLYILSQFSDRDFDWLMTAGRRKTVSAGNVLIYKGEPIDAFYIVLDGLLTVSVQKTDSSDQEEIAQMKMGEIVGEISFIDSRPPAATVKAIEDSLVWAIPRTQLAAKLLQDVEFASHFYHAIAVFLSDRLRGTVSRLGFEKDQPENEGDINPQVVDSLDLAQARLSWLLNRLRGG